MKKAVALLLALVWIAALSGCIAKLPGETLPQESDGPETGDTGKPADSTPPDTAEDTAPADTETQDTAPALPLLAGFGPVAEAVGAAAAEKWEFVNTADAAKMLADGSASAAVLPVGAAARIYNETEGKIAVAALLTSGGWVIAEQGDTVKDIFSLAGKTVYVPTGEEEAAAVFGYIAEEYGFEIGSTLKLEAASDARGKTPALLPGDLYGNSAQRAAIDLLAEWKDVTGESLWPGLCLAVRKDAEGTDSLTGAAKKALEGAKAAPGMEYAYVTGAEPLRESLRSYLSLLYKLDPKLIGGYIPDDGFYLPKNT